jgi:multidrug transporter EmrE-like cation transporter
MRNYLYIFGSILFTVYGQLVTKWQMQFLFDLILNPWIISSLGAAFLAFLCWIVAMSKFELSYAYPFTSLAFVVVLILSGVLLRESITFHKLLGTALIIGGIIIASRG